MKRLIYSVIFCLSISTLSFSQQGESIKSAPPEGNAMVGDFYGADIAITAQNTAVSVEELVFKLEDSKNIKKVVVKGQVIDVCPKKGCWLTIKTEDGSSFFVKMKDYAFFVPIALKGKNVVLEGLAEKKVTSVKELKHYAKDAKKSKAEIEAITIQKEEISFLADGIKVVN